MSVDAPRAGIVLVSDTYYPGRRASVDGRRTPVLRVDLAFTGIPVAAGRHRVELFYLPSTVIIGAVVTLLTAAIWIGARMRPRGRETVKAKVV